MIKRVGIDIDGVIANFYDAYEARVRQVSGRDLFPPRASHDAPPVWDWPEFYGYSKEEVRAAWQSIKADPNFWYNLAPLPDFQYTVNLWVTPVDLYFITARPGDTAKAQTDAWFQFQGKTFTFTPTVLISSQKGLCCQALELDVYVDDKLENILDVCEQSRLTRAYLIDRPYNQATTRQADFVRVPSLGTVIEKEGLLGE